MSWDKVVQKEQGGDNKENAKILAMKEGQKVYMRVLDEVPHHIQQIYFPKGNAGKGAFFPATPELKALASKLNGEIGKKENKVSDSFSMNVLVFDAPVLGEKGKDTGKKADQVMVLRGGVTTFLPLRQMAESKQYGDLRQYNIEFTRTGKLTYTVVADRQNSELEGVHAELAKNLYNLEEVAGDVPPIPVQIDIAKGMTWTDAWAKNKPKEGQAESGEDGSEEVVKKDEGRKLSAEDFDKV